MKILKLLVVLCLGICSTACGQISMTFEQKVASMAKIDSLYDDFLNFQGLYDENGISKRVANKYLNLFEPRAKVFDDINYGFLTGNNENPFHTQTRSIEEYIELVKTNFIYGLRINIINSKIDYNNLEKRQVDLTLLKQISGSAVGYDLDIIDTVILRLNFTPNFEYVLISSIDNIGYSLTITNDKDKDLIVDKEDQCPDIAGDKDYKGCPAPWGPSLFVGGAFSLGIASSNITGMDVNSLGGAFSSSDFDYGQSSFGKIKNISTPVTFSINFNLDFFPWRKRRLGFSTGIGYTHLRYETQLDDMSLSYRHKDQTGEYERILKISSEYEKNPNFINEKLSLHFIDIPLIIKWKPHVDGKRKWYLGCNTGIVNRILVSGISTAKGNMDFEGIYNFIGSLQPSQYLEGHAGNYLCTRHALNIQNKQVNEATALEFRQNYDLGYDVGLNKTFKKRSEFKFKNNTSFILQPIIYKKLSSRALLSIGLAIVASNYKIVNDPSYRFDDDIRNLEKTTYTSYLNGSTRIKSASFSALIGLMYGLNKPYFK